MIEFERLIDNVHKAKSLKMKIVLVTISNMEVHVKCKLLTRLYDFNGNIFVILKGKLECERLVDLNHSDDY